MEKKNLRNRPSDYQMIAVNSDTDPHHPMIDQLRKYVETSIEANMPECVFGVDLFKFNMLWGWYFILLDSTDHRIIGYAHATSGRGNVLDILHFCTNNQVYKGAGTRLMNDIVHFAKQEGYRVIQLDSMDDAVSFYEKQGFQKQYKEGDYENDCKPMKLNLTKKGGTRRRKKRVFRKTLRH